MKKIFFSMVLLLPFLGLSQTPKDSSVTVLKEVVLTPNRWKQTANEVPQKVTVINSSAVALQNPQTVADLLTISGKVFMQKS